MKIPAKLKGEAVACGRWFVFAPLLKCGPAFMLLQKREEKRGIPGIGKLTIKGKVYYYCLYGLVNDPETYAKPKKK